MVANAHHTLPGRLLTVAAVCLVALVSVLSVASAASARAVSCPHATTTFVRGDRAELQQAVVCLINRERTSHHLPALVPSSKLDLSAQRWSDSMVSDGDFTHGAAFFDRISAAGFDWTQAGENIATGYATPVSVVRAWMASPGHCANILDPQFREVGTGVVDRSIRGVSSGGATWTQDFGRLMDQPALSDDTAPARACYR